jgi:hypothetical protein
MAAQCSSQMNLSPISYAINVPKSDLEYILQKSTKEALSYVARSIILVNLERLV